MQLQKQLSRKYQDKEYTKFVIVLKQDLVEKLGWKSGQELKTNVKGSKLIIEKRRKFNTPYMNHISSDSHSYKNV